MKATNWLLIMLLTGGSATASADRAGDTTLAVSFADCREYVAFGPISLSKAQAAIPEGFKANNIEGNGGLVARVSACESVSMDGAAPHRAIIAHYGINIVSPDGSGDINNYTLVYVTNHLLLAARLRRMGFPAVYNTDIAVEDPALLPGPVYISVFGDGVIPYTLTGDVTAPASAYFPFLANWWYTHWQGTIKQSTYMPQIAFGPAGLALQTSSPSALGLLIGGNYDDNFPWYNVRGVFASATMEVTVTR